MEQGLQGALHVGQGSYDDLEVLDISRCWRLSDSGIAHFASISRALADGRCCCLAGTQC